MIQIRSYPAKNGDAFLLKASAAPFAMLIDGGYADTFHRYIKPDMDYLANSGNAIDLVVATHVDADHISGLLSFFRLNGTARAPAIIPVREVLHNSLCSLMAPTTGQAPIRQDDQTLLREIRLRGYRQPDAKINTEHEISARQGGSLAQLLRNGGYHWNKSAGATSIGGAGIAELCFPQAKITVLGPNRARLDALRKWWTSEIRSMGWIGSFENIDDVFEYVCSYEVADPGELMLSSSNADLATVYVPDNSVTNGSSISMVVEVEGCRLLFLADSWAEDTVAALSAAGPSLFELVKVSHHGSARNTSIDLLKLVDSPHFFISTNGDGHDHPDFAVLKAIVDRPAAFRRTLHFNYSTPASRRLRTYRSATGADFVVNEEETGWVTIDSTTGL